MIVYTPENYTPSKNEREIERRAADEDQKRAANMQPLEAETEK